MFYCVYKLIYEMRDRGCVEGGNHLKGPNDARLAIWVLGEFSFFFSYFLRLTNVLYILMPKYASGKAATTKTGHLDHRWVFFPSFLHVFLMLTNVLYIMYIGCNL